MTGSVDKSLQASHSIPSDKYVEDKAGEESAEPWAWRFVISNAKALWQAAANVILPVTDNTAHTVWYLYKQTGRVCTLNKFVDCKVCKLATLPSQTGRAGLQFIGGMLIG